MARTSRIPHPLGGRFIQVHAWAIKAVGFPAAAVLGLLDFLDRAQELPGQPLASRAQIVACLEDMVSRNKVDGALAVLVEKGWVALHKKTELVNNFATRHFYSLDATAISKFLAGDAGFPQTGKPAFPKQGNRLSPNRDLNGDALPDDEQADNPCAAMDSGDPIDSGGGDKKENVVVVNTTTTTPTPETTNPTSPCAGEMGPLPSVDKVGGTAEEPVEVDLELEDNIKHLADEILPLIKNLDQASQQNLLDEMSGGIAAGKISSPASWMWSMVQKARGEKPGGFKPARALDVRKAREARKAAEARKQQEEAEAKARKAAEAAAIGESAQRLAEEVGVGDGGLGTLRAMLSRMPGPQKKSTRYG